MGSICQTLQTPHLLQARPRSAQVRAHCPAVAAPRLLERRSNPKVAPWGCGVALPKKITSHPPWPPAHSRWSSPCCQPDLELETWGCQRGTGPALHSPEGPPSVQACSMGTPNPRSQPQHGALSLLCKHDALGLGVHYAGCRGDKHRPEHLLRMVWQQRLGSKESSFGGAWDKCSPQTGHCSPRKLREGVSLERTARGPGAGGAQKFRCAEDPAGPPE